jgi:hypothetical protein
MSIAQEIFEAFLKCPTKAYLYSARTVGVQSESCEWQWRQQEEFKQTGWKKLRSALRTGEWYEGTLPLQALEKISQQRPERTVYFDTYLINGHGPSQLEIGVQGDRCMKDANHPSVHHFVHSACERSAEEH